MRRLICVLAAGSISCAGMGGLFGGSDDEDEGLGSLSDRGGNSIAVTYGRTAKDNWARGERSFADDSFLAAQKYYRYIRVKFPYSAYAVRAELRIADCYFGRERYLEAVDAFQNFIRLHPTHHDVSYATLMTGKSYYEQIPTDWFFMPPAHEKDQASVRDAEMALRTYVERFSDDERIEEGRKLLVEVRMRLVEHERYVADFYEDQDKPRARVGRLEIIRSKFGDVALDDELLVEIAEVYAELGERAKVAAAVSELETKFPKSDKISDAKEILAEVPEPEPDALKPVELEPDASSTDPSKPGDSKPDTPPASE